MKKSLVTTLTVILIISGNAAFAGDKGGSRSGGNQSSHSNLNRPSHASPNPKPTESINSGLQLALADAKANLDQALNAAGSDVAARKAAREAYRNQVKEIKKALNVK